MPWELRVLAVRLQSVGFSDGRKGVMGYYDLAREARAELARRRMRMQLRARSDTGEAATKEQEKEEETESGEADENEERRRRRREIQMWTDRLSDLGIRVASALVEMGDLDGAAHHLELLALASASASASQQQAILEELPPGNQKHSSRLGLQRAILWLKIGDAAAARRCVERDEKGADIIDALASMADGQYGDAVAKWEVLGRRYAAEEEEGEEAGLYKQNLAVCLLYAGRMEDVSTTYHTAVFLSHLECFPGGPKGPKGPEGREAKLTCATPLGTCGPGRPHLARARFPRADVQPLYHLRAVHGQVAELEAPACRIGGFVPGRGWPGVGEVGGGF